MDKKNLEEIQMLREKAKKDLAEKIKSLNEEIEQFRKVLLILKALGELSNENPDFKRQFESKLEELSQKEEAATQGKP